MKVLTVKELVNLLNKYPEEAAVFGYSEMDEGDFPIEVVEFIDGTSPERNKYGIIVPPHCCQADSTILEYWEAEGNKPIICLRTRMWSEY
jgi:hypothetical protein